MSSSHPSFQFFHHAESTRRRSVCPICQSAASNSKYVPGARRFISVVWHTRLFETVFHLSASRVPTQEDIQVPTSLSSRRAPVVTHYHRSLSFLCRILPTVRTGTRLPINNSASMLNYLHDIGLKHLLGVVYLLALIGGYTYNDVLTIYGASRAGYIPQLFSLRLPNPDVIYELLHKANAKALVHESGFAQVLQESPFPTHLAVNARDIIATGPLPDLPCPKPEDVAFFFHTSGSSGGSPKLIPYSYRWLDSAVMKSHQICMPKNPERQDVTVWMGSMCHVGQTFMLIGSLQHGACVIQPTQISFPPTELVAMVHRCGLNRLNQFAAFLANNHLRASRHDPKLLSLLMSFDEVLYSGMPLAREEEEWAYRNGIKLRNLFGSTEVGASLISVGCTEGNVSLLQPLDGTAYRFVPTSGEADAAAHQSTARMLEFIILAESPDCPDVSLRHADGHFHTGDLFLEPFPGQYISCGRDDDWIKSENSLRCDTKSIEDNARLMCGNLIGECIVVGSGRPSPVLFVEQNDAVDMDPEKLKKEIIRKTRQFHSRRYLHERITSTKFVVVVPPKSLPRTLTKGNIRRKAVEETYKSQLDQIYAC